MIKQGPDLGSGKGNLIFGLAAITLVAGSWIGALVFAPTESHQGEVYRILYLHVPAALSAFFCSFLLLIFSLNTLRGSEGSIFLGRASAELGLLFTILTLATGSLWGRPTWGVWWTWDARLTTTFILFLLYCGYLLLWSSLPHGPLKNKVCPVLGILIAADIPIIYKSVTWWRTLHQPPSLLRESGAATMSPEIRTLLICCCISALSFCLWLIWQRTINLRLEQELERLSSLHMQKQEGLP